METKTTGMPRPTLSMEVVKAVLSIHPLTVPVMSKCEAIRSGSWWWSWSETATKNSAQTATAKMAAGFMMDERLGNSLRIS